MLLYIYINRIIMDTNQALILALRYTFCKLLCAIDDGHQLWHYAILLPESNKNSLASLLRLKLYELVHILRICGLVSDNNEGNVKLRKTQNMKSKSYSWTVLLHDAKLEENNCAKMRVKKINKVKHAMDWNRTY